MPIDQHFLTIIFLFKYIIIKAYEQYKKIMDLNLKMSKISENTEESEDPKPVGF